MKKSQLDNEKGVKELLSLGNADPILVETFCSLRESGIDSWEYIADLCCRHSNIEDVVKVIVAVTASLPTMADKWFNIILEPIRIFTDFPEHHPDPGFSPEYVLAFVKGIFEASNWYDKNFFLGVFAESPLVEKMEFLHKYFLLKNPVTEMAEKLLENSKFADKYESRLSQLIKTLVKYERNRGVRMASATKFCQNAFLIMERNKLSYEDIPRLGTMIFDQFSYAIFGSMSVYGRTKMAHLHIQDLLSVPEKKQ